MKGFQKFFSVFYVRLFPFDFFPLISYFQYGDVLNVVMSGKKKGSALVEFATVRAAVST